MLPSCGRAPSRAIFRFRGGKIVERWGVLDQLGLMRQLGAMPAREPAEQLDSSLPSR